MKKRVSGIVKKIIGAISSIVKAKTMALKSKTTALKTRIAIFSLLRNKKILMSSISQKLEALVTQKQQQRVHEEEYHKIQSNALILESNSNIESIALACMEISEDAEYLEEEEEKYPDLTHTLFEEEEGTSMSSSVIEMVKHSKEEAGQEFRLEDEIDHVADLFIQRFHRQIQFQKQLSFKRHHQQMLLSPPA